jgi:hypothetical protein
MRAQKIVSFPLGILLLLIVAFVLWKLITLDFLVFGIPEREGITDTHPTTFKITGRSNSVFQADIPLNYIQYRKYAEKAAEEQSWLFLWALYPTFEGYSDTNAAKFGTSYKNDSPLIRIRIYQIYSQEAEDQLAAEYGQKGMQGLLSNHSWLLLSNKQAYGNPTEYYSLIPWRSQDQETFYRYYIFDAGNHALLINCGIYSTSLKSHNCTAKKRWRNTPIIIEFTFKIDFLRNIGRIEAEIENLVNSFNIRETTHGR